MNRKKHYNFLDYYKIFAMMLIVWYHSFISYRTNVLHNASSIIVYILYSLAALGVPVFFTVNGFLLFDRPIQWKSHLAKIVRIILKTAVWGSIALAVLMTARGESIHLSEFLKDLVHLRQGYINHLWFMEALVYIYILFPVIKWIYDRNKILFYIGFYASVALFFFIPSWRQLDEFLLYYNISLLHAGTKIFDMLPVKYFMYSTTYFVLGGLLKNILPKLPSYKNIKHTVVFGGILAAALAVHILYGFWKSAAQHIWFDSVWTGYDSIFTLTAVAALFMFGPSLDAHVSTNLIKKCAANTLGIYFIHPVLIKLSMPFVQNILEKSAALNLVYAVIIFIFSFILTLGLRKIPVVKWLFEI